MQRLLLALLMAVMLSMGATTQLQCQWPGVLVVQPDGDNNEDEDLGDKIEEEIEEI